MSALDNLLAASAPKSATPATSGVPRANAAPTSTIDALIAASKPTGPAPAVVSAPAVSAPAPALPAPKPNFIQRILKKPMFPTLGQDGLRGTFKEPETTKGYTPYVIPDAARARLSPEVIADIEAKNQEAIKQNSLPQKAKNFVSSLGKSTSEILGTVAANTGADIIAEKKTQETLDGVNNQKNTILANLHTQIQADKLAGKDTSHAEDIYRKVALTPGTTVQDILPSLNKTNRQALGEILNLGLTLLTAGEYSAVKGASAIAPATKSFELTKGLTGEQKILQSIIKEVSGAGKRAVATTQPFTAVKTALKAGAVKVAKDAPVGYAFDVAQNLQDDKKGAATFKPGVGTVLGAGIPAALALDEARIAGKAIPQAMKEGGFVRLNKEGKESLPENATPQEIMAKAQADAAHLGTEKPLVDSNVQLAETAKKFKNSDEFIKAQTVIDHATNGEVKFGETGAYFAPEGATDSGFGSKIEQRYISPTAKVYTPPEGNSFNYLQTKGLLDVPDPKLKEKYGFSTLRELVENDSELSNPNDAFLEVQRKAVPLMKKESGADIILLKNEDELNPTQYIVQNPDALKTKSELNEIYNKATKSPDSSLPVTKSELKPSLPTKADRVNMALERAKNGEDFGPRAKATPAIPETPAEAVRRKTELFEKAEAAERKAQQGDLRVAQANREKPKNTRLPERKKAFDDGYEKMQREEAIRGKKESDVYRAKTTVPEKNGFSQKLKAAFAPAKSLEPETRDIFMKWERRLNEARTIANKELGALEDVPRGREGFDTMLDYEAGKPGKYTEKIKEVFDGLFNEAKARGIDAGYRENYLPHVYAESPKVINAKIEEFLIKEKGLSPEEAEAYIKGQKLPPSEAKRLSLTPFFERERTFPTYKVAMEYGLTPRFTHPDQLAAYYREQMERVIANYDFIKSLQDSNKILTVEDAPQSWKPIELTFSPRGYYAEPKLARTLNRIFNDPANVSLTEQGFKEAANLSKKSQELALSGGIPYTNVNYFSLGQVLKDISAGKFSSAVAFFRANFNEASIRYFKANIDSIDKMAKQGIDVSSNLTSYQDAYKNILAHKNQPFLKKWWSISGENFDKAFNEKTFKSYMPQVQIQLFKSTYEKALKNGLPEAEASKLAGDTTKAFYGLIEKQGRSSQTENKLSAVFFAPKFREGIINTLFNTAKSVTTEIKNPAFKMNRRLFAGMALTYGLYNALNYKLNGHFMWDNPSGRESALRIPDKNGNNTYVEFMPSFLSFARNMFSGAIALGSGDLDTAKQKFGTLASMPIQLLTEVIANKDYFGQEIYNEYDTAGQRAKAIAEHIGLGVSHPYVAQAIKLAQGKTSLYHALVSAFEIPLKFGTETQEQKNEFYNALDKKAREQARASDKVKPIYDKLQKMKLAGQTQEANDIYYALPADQKKIYDNLKASDKRRTTADGEAAVYKIYEKAQKLKAKGLIQEANDLYNSLSDEQKVAYQKLKKRLQ